MSAETWSTGDRLDRVATVSRLAAPAILILALALRLYRLDGQSLWGDEGTSVVLALRDLASITQGAALDIHPPLYYYLLHFWMLVLGDGEIAVRSLSALLGTATVALTYLLGRKLFGRRVGLVAALLAALAPLQIHYSQEARMYMLATFLGLASVWLLVQAWSAHPGRTLAKYLMAWVIVASAGLYSHYFAATVLLAENLIVGLAALSALRPRTNCPDADRRGDLVLPLAPWFVAQVAVLASFLPWISVMLQQWNNWPAVSQPFSAGDLIRGVLSTFSSGMAVEPGDLTLAAVLFTLALAAACLPRRPGATSSPGPDAQAGTLSPVLVMVLYLMTPIATMYLLSLRRPLYNPKFLLVATPAFYLLAAQGVVRLADWLTWGWRRVSNRGAATGSAVVVTGLLALPLIAAVAGPLNDYYTNPRFARDDYRAISRTIALAERPGDAVILNAPGQVDIFGYYYHGSLPIYPLPRQRPLDQGDTAAQLQAIVGNHQRLWTVLWGVAESDPQRFIETWLDGAAYKSTDRWFGNVRLALYSIPSQTLSLQERLDAAFGADAGVRLLGYGLAGEPVAGGDILQLSLFWQVSAPVGQRYKVFTHLLGPGDTLWGQRDSEPVGGLRPTTTWKPGETVQDNYGILVLPGTPPGDYQVEVGMYSPETGERLPVLDALGRPTGDRVLLGPVRVDRPAAPLTLEALNLSNPLSLDFGGAVRLLGYDLVQPNRPDPPQLVLYWQLESEGADVRPVLQLVAPDGSAIRSQTDAFVLGSYPSTRWTVDEFVRDPHPLELAGLPKGSYRLRLAVEDASRRLVTVSGARRSDSDGFVSLDEVLVP